MNDFDQLGDTVSTEIDKRKIEKLIDDGVITPEELANAGLVHLVCPNNQDHGLTNDGELCATCKVKSIEIRPEDE